MKQTLERLWNDYLLEENATLGTDEERRLTKESAALYEKARAMLNAEQTAAVQKYIDALCTLDATFAQRAFIKGCEFAVSFLLGSMNTEKR